MQRHRRRAALAPILLLAGLVLSGCFRRTDLYPLAQPRADTPGEAVQTPCTIAEAAPVETAPPEYRLSHDPIDPPAVAREFRGVWVATVANMDWPSRRSLGTDAAQAELLRIMDTARDIGLNAVILQVRPSADAFYASDIEPWSDFLTGESGRAPDPWWDPLAFAVEAAHARGLELHAWFNPFRAGFVSKRTPMSASHVLRRRPELVRTYGTFYWLDPGEPDARRRAIDVVTDVVRRYDVDAVHIDDYFYPYHQRDRRNRLIPFPDEATWTRYGRATGMSRDDWRRSNVDRFVEDLYNAVRREKEHVRVGISPFGIWRPGHPASVRGLDAYGDLYADTRKWLNNGWADYYAPQLYWRVAAPEQPYTELLEWWASQNLHGRHVWAGNHPNRVATGGSPWDAWEILEQVRLTRQHPGFTGNVHFSASSLLRNPDGLGDALRAGWYGEPALVPASPWLSSGTPPRPAVHAVPDAAGRTTIVSLRSTAETPSAWIVQTHDGRAWNTLLVPGVSREARVPWSGAAPDIVSVRLVDRAGMESDPVILRLHTQD
jgi:uncharacterized lipoprotein YddW (UPF0748 family)